MRTRILKIGVLQIALGTICFVAGAAESSFSPATPPRPNLPAASPSASLSPWAAQISKLAEARINEDIILSYVDSAGTFNLTAEQIIKLSEAGVPGNVISAMIQHDAEIIAGCRQVIASTVPESDTPVLVFSAPTSPPESSSSRETAPSPTEWLGEEQPALGPDLAYNPYFAQDDRTEIQERSPVRKPYAVKLTDPIIIYRGYGRTPNVQLLEIFP